MALPLPVFITLLCLSLSYVHMVIAKSSCGTQMTCFGMPRSCVASDETKCEILFRAASDKKSGKVEMEITANPDNQNRWFSVGFSEDARMGEDTVFDCILLSNGNVVFKQSYNIRKSNKEPDDFEPGISDVNTHSSDGRVICKWKTDGKHDVRGKKFDILNLSYHVLLAKGPIKNEKGSKGYHSDRTFSSERLSLQSSALVVSNPSDTSSSKAPPDYLIKTHGSLMVITWVGLVSVAIMIARHFKEYLGEGNVCGTKLWFLCHRTLMVISLVLVLIALYMSYTFVNGWSGPSLHPLLGVTCVGFMFFQMIIAMMRCHPESSSRWIFNWAHFLAGNAAHILAIAAIFTAVDAASLPRIFLYVMIAFVLTHVFIHLVIQSRSRTPVSTKDFRHPTESRHVFEMELKQNGRKGRSFRLIILAIYIMGVTGFTAALTLIILDKI